MHISPTIHYNAGQSIHVIIQELMNLLRGNKFSPREDFFVNPFGSDVTVLTNHESVHEYVGTGFGRSTCSGTMKLNRFAPGKFHYAL